MRTTDIKTKVLALVLTIAALVAGKSTWATEKTVAYRITNVTQNGGTSYTLTFGLADGSDAPFDGSSTYNSITVNTTTATDQTVTLGDGFSLRLQWAAGTNVIIQQTIIDNTDYGWNINTTSGPVTYTVSCSSGRYFATHLDMRNNQGNEWMTDTEKHIINPDFTYAHQLSQSYNSTGGFGRLTIQYTDAPPINALTSPSNNTYYITSKRDLAVLAAYVNVRKNNCSGLTFLQTQDITCDDTYVPIGYNGLDGSVTFCGTYDGQGHTVSNINVTRTGTDNKDDGYIGLFGYTDGCTVRNVVLANSLFIGKEYVGGIVGYSSSSNIRNCRVEGSVTIKAGADGARYHGGIAGNHSGYGTPKIIGCASAASVLDNGKANHKYCGGIVGHLNNYAQVEDCLYTGTTVEAASYKGAIVGHKNSDTSTITNNYYTNIELGGMGAEGSSSDQNGARRARTVTLGENIGLVGSETAYYDVSRLTAIGTTALRCGSYIYSGENQTLTLNYSGEIAAGYNAIKYNVISGDGQTDKNGYGLVDGYTFQMPAADMIASVNSNDLALILLDDDSARPAGKKNADYIALGGSGKKVILQGRTLYQDGEWNTICLPFSLDNLNGTSLQGATLMELDVDGTYDGDKKTGFDASTGTLNLYFKLAKSITAGTPYIIKWGNREGEAGYLGTTIVSPLFNSIDISPASPTTVQSADRKVSFVGTYSATPYNSMNTSVLFLGSGNKIYYPQKGASIGALRAYFALDGITAGNPANSIKMFFGDEQTGVTTPLAPWRGVGGEAWYTIDGRRLSGKPTQRGIYVNNGQKSIIK